MPRIKSTVGLQPACHRGFRPEIGHHPPLVRGFGARHPGRDAVEDMAMQEERFARACGKRYAGACVEHDTGGVGFGSKQVGGVASRLQTKNERTVPRHQRRRCGFRNRRRSIREAKLGKG